MFQLLKGAYPSEAIRAPDPCEEEAPEDINAYTDGSLIHPTSSQFSLGGAGVWWPNRRGQDEEQEARGAGSVSKGSLEDLGHTDHPAPPLQTLSTTEKEMAYSIQKEE